MAKAMAANEPMLATHFLQKLQEWVSGSPADLTICDYTFTVTEDRRAVKYMLNGRQYVDKLDPQQSIRIHELERSCGFTGRGQRRVSSTQLRRM